MLRTNLLLLIVCPLFAVAQGTDSLWKPLPIKFDQQVLMLRADPNTGDLYLTGFGNKANAMTSALVKWNGINAALMQPPFDLGSNMIVNRGKILISGRTWQYNKLASYDGQFWKVVDSSETQTKSPVSILDSNIVIGGPFDSIAGRPIKTVALWDCDTGWKDLYDFDTAVHGGVYNISSVLRYKGQIYVAGSIVAPNSIYHIARFDGKNWKDVGGGLGGGGFSFVSSMLVWKNELYVAGSFTESSGAPGNCIARWDGQNWHRLGSGVTGAGGGTVYDMAVYHDNLYVVGAFWSAGGVDVYKIAKWDGSRWCSLNTDFNQGTPGQIEVAKDELYISGQLVTINGDSVSHVARWNGGDYAFECGPIEPTYIAKTSIPDDAFFFYPSPVTEVLYTKRTDVYTLFIYDAAGQLIKSVTSEESKLGINVSHLTAGFYFAKVTFNNGVVISSKFVRQ